MPMIYPCLRGAGRRVALVMPLAVPLLSQSRDRRLGAPHPRVDAAHEAVPLPHLLRRHAASFLLFAALYGSVFFLAQFLRTGLGYTPVEAGLGLVPWTATLFVIARLAGWLADQSESA